MVVRNAIWETVWWHNGTVGKENYFYQLRPRTALEPCINKVFMTEDILETKRIRFLEIIAVPGSSLGCVHDDGMLQI